MTINNALANVPVIYSGSGTVGPFATTFYFIQASDLKVTREDANGNRTVLVLNTDYVVTGAGNQAGGSITTTSAIAVGQKIIIDLDVPYSQQTDYASNDPFPAETHERALDKLTILAKQAQVKALSAIRLPSSEPAPSELPRAALRANKALIFDASGNPTTSLADFTDAGASVVQAQAAATAAANSATAAANSATSAQSSLNTFRSVFLGAQASDPTLDGNGAAVTAGDFYWNTTTNAMRVYNGASWQDAVIAQPISYTTATYSGTGSQTNFTLPVAPSTLNDCEAFISGIRQIPTTNYTVSGTTLTFVAAPPSGTNNIFVRILTPVAGTTPGDGSVSTAKIVDNAVTNAKLAQMPANRIKGNNTGGAANAADLTAAQVKTLLAITEADITLSDITTGNVDTTRHGFVPKAPNNAAQYLDGTGNWSSPASIIWNHITGLLPSGISGTNTTATLSVSAGQCASSANNSLITLSNSVTWNVSNGNTINGYAGGTSLPTSATIHFFVCTGGSGTGIFASTSLAPTFPTGYAVASRRIFSLRTDSGGALLPGTAVESEGGAVTFFYATQILDLNNIQPASGTGALYSLTIPNDIKFQPLYRVSANATSSNSHSVLILSGDETAIAFSGNEIRFTSAPGFDSAYAVSGSGQNTTKGDGIVITNTSRQIRLAGVGGVNGVEFYWVTRGYKDFRRS